MDDNKDINNPINDAVSQDITNIPLTPEGMPIIENHTENKGEIQLPKTEAENTIETIKPQEELETKEDVNKEPVSTIAPIAEPAILNIVDNSEPDMPTHEIRTDDSLSEKADEDEQKFIENVKTAHEHNR